jgi:hypothetical protein
MKITAYRSHTRPVVHVDLPLQPGAIALLAGDMIVISAVTATHEWRISFDRRDVAVLGGELERAHGGSRP